MKHSDFWIPSTVAIFGLLFLVLEVQASADNILSPEVNAQVNAAINEAHRLHLEESPKWTALLHYKKALLVAWERSLVDDDRFFFASNGKGNSSAELDETIRAMFRPVATGPDLTDDEHPQCKFPARFLWLQKSLPEFFSANSSALAHARCNRLRDWLSALNPSGVTLIFPSAFINRPASMFGHTLLRIDNAANKDDKLLSYAANFAALTNQENAIVYAVRGLLGGYPGFFSLLPYYEKVKQYSDLENRDIWEYRLNLSVEETTDLLLHLWEMREAYFDYYYFDENCSYHLLSLLEVVRPEQHLTSRFILMAIPVDTVRAVERAGMISSVEYRPSQLSFLQHQIGLASSVEQSWSRELALGTKNTTDSNFAALPAIERAQILELAYSFLTYERVSGKRQTPEDETLAYHLLTERSQIDITKQSAESGVEGQSLPLPEWVESPRTPDVRPEEGHDTSRIMFGPVISNSIDPPAFDLEIRPSYHEILDPDDGYLKGAEIGFFTTAFRYSEEEGIRLEHLVPLDILSLAARNRFISPKSWEVKAEMRRRYFKEDYDDFTGAFTVGLGASYAIGESFTAFGLLDISSEYAGNIRDHFLLGMGPHVGFFTDIMPSFRAEASAFLRPTLLGDSVNLLGASLGLRYTLARNLALRLDLSHEQDIGREVGEIRYIVAYYW